MTRSERLAREGKVEVQYLGGFELAEVVKLSSIRGARYVCTDFDCRYDGKDVQADIYESRDGERLFAIIQ